MASPALCYGIPNIQLPRVGGDAINPCAFVGHELVVFFCPSDAAEAEDEIASYRCRLPDFEEAGAWVMGIVIGRSFLPSACEIAIATDPGGEGWAAFESLLDRSERSAEAGGGVFLFGRGGCLTRAWTGAGHAGEVVEALRRRD